jgi:phosphoribosylformylglycinamidine cyclo-ligase
MGKPKNVDYDSLDKAKNAFIAASRKTLNYAEKFGFVPGNSLGGSANIFSLDLKPFLKNNANELFLTLLPEGLGTADDARPEDLSSEEAVEFWQNIAVKTMSALTNDAAAGGLQTILIGLYLPSSTPELVFNQEFMDGFLNGLTDSCKKIGCVYFSGETPQLKNKIFENKLDIAGALFAISPPGLKPVTSLALAGGDQIVLVESSGPHENGFTLLRELAGQLPQGYRTKLKSGVEYFKALNAPSKLYTPFIQAILGAHIEPTSIENITGHGWQKIMRSEKNLRYVIEKMLPVPEIFKFVEEAAGLLPAEMLKIFNYGAGQAVFLKDKLEAEKTVEIAKSCGLNAVHAGYVEDSTKREVLIKPLEVGLSSDEFNLKKG